MSDAIETIKTEHRNIDRVLAALEDSVAGLAAAGTKSDLDLLYSTLYYIRVFPDKLHHPKEEEYLFKALRRRQPDSAALLDELEKKQHAEGGRLIAELERALTAYDRTYPDGLVVLQEATRTYVDAQREHIAKEEREVLPLARQSLNEEDWGDISGAFATNSDPMFGDNLETGFRALFERITRGPGPSGP